jgi:hypothetical protein
MCGFFNSLLDTSKEGVQSPPLAASEKLPFAILHLSQDASLLRATGDAGDVSKLKN